MRLSTLIAGAALLLGGCGKKEDAPAPAAPVAVPAPPPAAPRVSPVQVTASANRDAQTTVTAGWPVVVDARLVLKPGSGASLTLANPDGAWSDALRLECLGPDGADRGSLFKPAFASEKSIELTAQRSGQKVWVLDAVELPEGSYRIRIVVDDKKLGAALPAGVVSNDVALIVAPVPAAETPGAAQRKCLAQMSAAAWKGDPAKSLATAEAYLAEHPKDVAVRFKTGQILRSQGRKVEALAAFETALLRAEEQREPGGENLAIYRVVADLRRELAPK